MKLFWRSLMLVLAASALIAAQEKKADKSPSGTVVTKKHVDTEVQPAPKTVKVTPEIIKDAQKKLLDKGYKAGEPTGTMNATTRAAVRKYQQDEKLKVTGRLDENTLSHLNVGAGQTFGAAPGVSGGTLAIVLSFMGRRATVSKPPLSAPGVMLVILSLKRWVATSVSFIERSRLIETR